MKSNLKCYDCIHFISEFGDEASIGGGCENVIRCAARPEIETAIRLELKYYGNNGSPFSTWQCGQLAVDISPEVYDEDADDEWEALVSDLRDPVVESIDGWLLSLPTVMLISSDNKWLLRRESQIAEDVLWRAQKGRCWDYCKRPDDDDILLETHYRVDEEVIEPDDEEHDAYRKHTSGCSCLFRRRRKASWSGRRSGCPAATHLPFGRARSSEAMSCW